MISRFGQKIELNGFDFCANARSRARRWARPFGGGPCRGWSKFYMRGKLHCEDWI